MAIEGAKYVPGHGNAHATIMVIAEAPGEMEEKFGIPLVGPTGKMVNELLEDNGVHRADVYATNVYKYRPPNNDLRRLSEIGVTLEESEKQLWQEVDAINPNVIITLGAVATKIMTGKDKIGNWRGSVLPCLDGKHKVVPTYHPAALFKTAGWGKKGGMPWSTLAYIRCDIGKAIKQSTFAQYMPPRPLIEICKSSSQAHQFFKRYEGQKRAAVDIEVCRSVPNCVAIAFNKHHAMSFPLILMGDWERDGTVGQQELILIWRMLDKFFRTPGLEIIGQNFKFDHEKLERPCGFRIAPEAVWCDTQILAGEIHPEFPKSMAFLSSIYTNMPYHKDEGKEFDFKKHSFSVLMSYNAKDVIVNYEMADEMLIVADEMGVKERFFDFSMKLHPMYMEIDRLGFKVDEKQRDFLIAKYTTILETKQMELEMLAGYKVKYNSPVAVKAYLFKELKLPERDNTELSTLVALYNNNAKDQRQRESLRLISNLRRTHKALGTYLMAPTDFDGRMKTVYRITGTETGRTATSQPGPPVRPIIHIGRKKKKMGWAYHSVTKHGEFGADIRTMLVPDSPDHCFGEADLSQAEARIVALLANDQDLLTLFNTVDIHKLTATWLFGVKLEQVTKEMRFIGKQTRHASAYGMGKKRLMLLLTTEAWKQHIEIGPISEYKAGQILEVFHKNSPKIEGVFQKEVVAFLENNGRTLTNPFGRKRTFFERWGEELWKEAYSQIPQSTVADHLKEAMLRVRKRLPWLQIVLEAHDAFGWHCLKTQYANVAAIVKEELERPIDFTNCSLSRGSLVIPADVQYSDTNYKDLKAYKVAA